MTDTTEKCACGGLIKDRSLYTPMNDAKMLVVYYHDKLERMCVFTSGGEYIGSGGGEPEDQNLDRDFSWAIDVASDRERLRAMVTELEAEKTNIPCRWCGYHPGI